MQKQRTLLIIVLLALAINVITLGLLWFGNKDNRNIAGRPSGEEPGIWLSEQLSLTPDQDDQYANMRREHHESIVALERKKKKLKDALFSRLKENVSEQLLDSISGATGKLEAEKDLITYNHFKQLRQILSPAQQQKFDAIIQQMLERMGGERPPPGRDDMRRP